MSRKYISPLKELLLDFEKHKRYCGYKYESSTTYLYQFDKYYNDLNLKEIILSRNIIEPFISYRDGERKNNQINRATSIRQLCKFAYLNGYVNDVYIIPTISNRGEKEYIPYIFKKQELTSIINFLLEFDKFVIKPNGSFSQRLNMLNSVSTMMQILMFTGMRLNEVCNLNEEDIDLTNNLIYIRNAKNENQRIVPFGKNLKEIINTYLINANTLNKGNYKKLFFYMDNDNNINKVNGYTVYWYFRKALKYVGIEHKKGVGPRLHDFRHTAAVMMLIKLSKNEENINASLAYLSTFLGHKSFNETQKYIWLVPELMNPTLLKMEKYSSFINDIFEGGDYFE